MHPHSTIPHASGIYKITCIPTAKIYIGSAANLFLRCSRHLTDLRYNKHCNQKLQRAFQKHGESAFIFEVVELVLLPEMLIIREQYWFGKLNPFGKNGFNIATVAGSVLGVGRSVETRAKISAAKKGKPNPHPGNNFSNRGKHLPPEHRAKISATNRGKPSSRIGYKHTPEARARMSAAQRNTKRIHDAIEMSRIALGNTNNAKDYIITSPEGVEYTVFNMAQFCREHHLCKANLGAVAQGRRKHHKGWTARHIEI